MDAIGATTWVIAAARVPSQSFQEAGRLPRRADHHGHDRACVLNTGRGNVDVAISLFFDGRPSVGPFHLSVPAQSMRYIDFAQLSGPAPAPVGVDFCAVLTSGEPVVVQHVQRDVHGDSVTTVSSPAFAAKVGDAVR